MDEITSTGFLTADRKEQPHRRNVLVLQGGGALGSYQAGAYQALAESGTQLDWVAGVSIGAVNAAIIAGNPPGRRVARLREFWETTTRRSAFWLDLPYEPWRALDRLAGAAAAMIYGQPGFFRPRSAIEWMAFRPPVSLYDTSEFRMTIENMVDFDIINKEGGIRLSVGAVNVETGNMVYFDSAHEEIKPEHVMASGALPPGLAAVSIDGTLYWDGGLVSNTPLQYVMDYEPRNHMRVFQVDLFPAHGRLPETLDEVAEREKDIRYSSRTRAGTDRARRDHKLRNDLYSVLNRLPADLAEDAAVRRLREFACPETVDIVHLIYRPPAPQGSAKDYQFSRRTMEDRWKQGHRDGRATCTAAPWNREPVADEPVRIFDVLATASHSGSKGGGACG